MKTLKIKLSAGVLLASCLSVSAQDQAQEPVKGLRVNDVYVQVGGNLGMSRHGTLNEFKKLAPNSDLLNKISGDVSFYKGYNNENVSFISSVGFKIRNKEKTDYLDNLSFRVGISYLNGTSLSGYFNINETNGYDTLTSSVTGNTFYLDSVTSHSFNAKYSYDQVRLDMNVLFSTQSESRWSLYTGMGISFGMSINAETTISYNKNEPRPFYEPSLQQSSPNYYSSTYRAEKTELYRNQTNIGASAYIPMGVDFRFGNKKEFWKHLHLFYEMRPGINYTSIPELGNQTNAFMLHSIGVRYSRS